jgi:hypothetical protein
MKKLTGSMRERGFCTWPALTWNKESGVDVADFAFLETSLVMRGYEGGAFREEYSSRLTVSDGEDSVSLLPGWGRC